MNDTIIRNVTIADTEELLRIYSYYVEETAVSFEYDVPSAAEFARRITDISSGYPYLAAVRGGRIIGYAYAHAFVGREAYRFSAELTIYLDKDERRHGTGRLLYDALESKLAAMGITNLYACIGVPSDESEGDEYITRDSERFHNRLGFKTVGLFTDCGYKFDRWYSMIWAEKLLKQNAPEAPHHPFFDENYAAFLGDIGEARMMVLSTAANGRVSSRTMSVVQSFGVFYFQTDRASLKYRQLKCSNSAALCIDNIQIEGVCEETGRPQDNEQFCELFEKHFKGSFNAYTTLENERLFAFRPTFAERWVYKDGEPFIERFDIENRHYSLEKYTGE